MAAMFAERVKLEQMPLWSRLSLIALLFLSILSMHGATSGEQGGLTDHHSSITIAQSAVSSVVAAGDSVTHLVGAPQPSGESGLSMSDCGGVSAVCLAMIVGASAYIVLRGRVVDRVLWQLPINSDMPFGRPGGPFEALSPRERSSVLRR